MSPEAKFEAIIEAGRVNLAKKGLKKVWRPQCPPKTPGPTPTSAGADQNCNLKYALNLAAFDGFQLFQ